MSCGWGGRRLGTLRVLLPLQCKEFFLMPDHYLPVSLRRGGRLRCMLHQVLRQEPLLVWASAATTAEARLWRLAVEATIGIDHRIQVNLVVMWLVWCHRLHPFLDLVMRVSAATYCGMLQLDDLLVDLLLLLRVDATVVLVGKVGLVAWRLQAQWMVQSDGRDIETGQCRCHVAGSQP